MSIVAKTVKFGKMLALFCLCAGLFGLSGCNQSFVSGLESAANSEAQTLSNKQQNLLSELNADPSLQKVQGGKTDDPAPGFGNIIPGSEQDFVLNVGREIYFTEGSYKIERIASETLDMQIAWLKRYPNWKVKLQGHFDDPVPPKPIADPEEEKKNKGLFSIKREPTPEVIETVGRNWATQAAFDLSDKRAKAAMNYMIERGISAERLQEQGYGHLLPVRDCSEISCKALNRRVVSSLRVSFNPLMPENL